MRIKKALLLMVFLLVALMPIWPAVYTTAQEPETVKIGGLWPLTGELAKMGEDVSNGVKMAFEEINAAGGIKSLGGAKLELVLGDSQGKPDIGISEVERLIEQEGVAAMIGCYQSAVTLPATQAAERLKTPFVVDIAVADEITERDFEWVFRVGPKADWYTRDQVQFVQDLEEMVGYKVEKVALLHEDTDFGESSANGQKKWLEEAGIEVLLEVSYPSNAADLTTEVSKVKDAGPDAVLTVTYLNDAVLIAQAREKLGMTDIPFVDDAGGAIDPAFIERLGDTAEGIMTVVEYSKYIEGAADLNDRFRERYGEDITGNSANSYQAGLVMADALERAGSIEKEAIRDALMETDIPKGPMMVLPAERLKFGEDGQNQFARFLVGQIQNGELIPVWPAELAAALVDIPGYEPVSTESE
jgi:branched-chain amino acid transport system substrate-binding protein